jgi:hypothetical protein
MGARVSLEIAEEGTSPEGIATLTGFLRTELASLGAVSLARPAGELPAGARGVDPAAVAGLLVTLGDSADGLNSLVRVVRGWMARGKRGTRSVRIKLGDDELELDQLSGPDQERLLDLFLARHSPDGSAA